MPRLIDLTGRRFGRLVVSGRSDSGSGQAAPRWRCLCDCGRQTEVLGPNLRRGLIRSCGCIRSETTRARFTTHGEGGATTRTPEHIVWRAMLARCLNERNPAFKRYGGRGITVCQRWRESFEAFLADMGRRPSPQHEIDRRDNDGPYDPSNCRWATPTTQARNRRSNRMVTAFGVTLTLAEWVEALGVPRERTAARLNAGWPAEEALAGRSQTDTDRIKRLAEDFLRQRGDNATTEAA